VEVEMSVDNNPKGVMGGALYQTSDKIGVGRGAQAGQKNITDEKTDAGKAIKSYFTKMPSSKDFGSDSKGVASLAAHRIGWTASTAVKATLLAALAIPLALGAITAIGVNATARSNSGFESAERETYGGSLFLLNTMAVMGKANACLSGGILFLAGHGGFKECYRTADNTFNHIINEARKDVVNLAIREGTSSQLGAPSWLLPRGYEYTHDSEGENQGARKFQ
jgi:hypothetical protein